MKTESAPDRLIMGIPFAGNSHPMWVFDRETLAFLDVNDAAARTYGYSREEFLRMNIVQIRPPEEVPELLRETKSPRAKGPNAGDRWRHWNKNREIFTVAITSWEVTFRGRAAELVLARRDSE